MNQCQTHPVRCWAQRVRGTWVGKSYAGGSKPGGGCRRTRRRCLRGTATCAAPPARCRSTLRSSTASSPTPVCRVIEAQNLLELSEAQNLLERVCRHASMKIRDWHRKANARMSHMLYSLDSGRLQGGIFENSYFAEMGSFSGEGSFLRRIDLCITQL